MPPIEIKPHQVILFQGDSITDTGRSRAVVGPNHPQGLGFGYPRLIADRLLDERPGEFLQIYNRGLSGDKIQDLANRWPQDTLRLLPDILSILIGVNDTWNYLFLGLGSSPEQYRQILRETLQNTIQQLPDIQLVLCEPFVLITGEVTAEWREDIDQRREIVQLLAREYQGVMVPFQSALDTAARDVPPDQLLDDGVHPTELGHQVLAESWLKSVLG